MGKFDEDIKEAIAKLNGKPYMLHEWKNGFIVITVEAFNKLSKRKQKALFKNTDEGGDASEKHKRGK